MPPELQNTPELPDINEATQEALLLQGEEVVKNGEETNSLLQALIAQGENDNDDLIKAQIAQDDENTDKIVQAIEKDKESNFNFSLEGVEMATLTGPQGEKGDKGDKGDTGSVELTMPDGTMQQSEGKIVIKGLKGDKGDKGDKGEKGADGRDGVDGKVILGMNGKNGIDGKDGIDGEKGDKGDKGEDGSPDTPKQIKKKLESLKDDERLDVKAIKGIEKFQKQIDRVAGFASQGQEYRIGGTKIANNAGVLNFVAGSNTTITGVPTSDGATVTITATGGGSAVDSVNGQTGVVVLDADDISETASRIWFTTAEETKLGGIEALADVTDTANVTAAGALMDSEVDVDIKTLSLPANTTITAAAATVLDDATVGDMVNTLGGATSTGTGGLVRTGSPALVTPSIAAITVSGGILTLPTGATDTLVSKNSTDTLTNKRITKRTGTTTSSATPTINTDNVDFYSLTAQTVDITSFTTNLSGTPTGGQTLWIAITGTGTRAITWGASFEASTVALPTTTVSTNRLDIGFVWNSVSSKWRCIATA